MEKIELELYQLIIIFLLAYILWLLVQYNVILLINA